MKRFIAFLMAVILCSGIASAQKDTLKVLAIGNSFSVDAVEQNLFEIAAERGYVFIIGNLYIGGCSLERHYNNSVSGEGAYSYRKISADGVLLKTENFPLESALKEEKWDVITMQQASHYSGFAETYEPYLTDLIKYVRKYQPEAKLYWHQTWAYALDSTHPNFPNYDNDQQKMYSLIMKCSRKASFEHGMGIIPCGSTIQNMRMLGKETELTRDGYHLSYKLGRYAAALTWFCKLTGENLEKVHYRPEGVGLSDSILAQIAAASAVSHPYKTSVSIKTK